MEHSDYNAILGEFSMLLAVVAFITASFRKSGMNPILGLFGAGMVLGPHGMQFLKYEGAVAFMADLGIMFLLFIVGLELSLDRIRAMAKYIFGLGTLHFVLSALGLGAALHFGVGLKPFSAGALGVALAMSSTAFVLQLLSERGKLASTGGRQTFSVLLLQDLMVGPLLAVVPLIAVHRLAATESHEVAMGLLPSAIAMIVVFVVAKLVLEQLLDAVRSADRNDAAFPAAILLAALAMGWVAVKLGMSPGLGAFLAGLALSGASWRHDVKAVIHPFEATLLAFFFIGIGTLVPISGNLQQIAWLVAAAAMIVTIKTVTGFAACLLNGIGWRRSLRVGLYLAQGGEFAFILIAAIAGVGLLGKEASAFWTGAGVVSMAMTPFLVAFAERFREPSEADCGKRDANAAHDPEAAPCPEGPDDTLPQPIGAE